MSEDIARQFGIKFIEGAYVAEVDDGPAKEGGILRADIITAIGDKPIKDFDSLLLDVRSRKVGDKVTLTINRKGKEQKLEVILGKAPTNPNR
jgi:S1-C subfamily serine protease